MQQDYLPDDPWYRLANALHTDTMADLQTARIASVGAAKHRAFCYTYLLGFAALDARESVRQFKYALQDLRNDIASGRAQLVE